MKASANAEIVLRATTVHPDWLTFLFVIIFAVSQIKCLTPFKQWKVNGSATSALVATWRNTGQAAKLAAMTADSRCQPRYGATR